MDELKRCPFCGEEAEKHKPSAWKGGGGTKFWAICISCKKCDATVDGRGKSREEAENAAIAAWNRREYSERHNPKPLTLKRLQEIIESDKADNAIWVKEINSSIWTRAILDYDNDRGIFAVWHGGEDQSDFYIAADYYKTWLAYDYPPEEA